MNYYIVSALFNATTTITCILLVLLSKNKNATVKTFLLFSSFVAAWSTLYFFWLTSSNYNSALFFSKALHIASFFIPQTFFLHCCYLLGQENKYKKLNRLLLTFNLLLFPLTFTPLYVTNVEPALMFPFWPKPGALYILFISEYILLVTLALVEIYKKMSNTTIVEERRMLQFVFYGLLVGFIGGSTNFLLIYDIPIPPIGNILVSCYTFGVTYAILRYQFMDIALIIRTSIVYTILISLITIFYLVFIFFTEHAIQSILRYQSIFISLSFSTIIALIFIPLKTFIQNLVEKQFFKGTYNQIIVENELLRQEIIRSERLKTIATLASGMAHEIKNPLTPIKTFAEQLPKRLDDKEFLLKFSRIISNEVNRIDTLVQELLDYAKPTPPQLKPTGIHQLIDHTTDFLNNDFIKHKITLIKNYQLPAGQALNIDENQFRQVLLNILLNAIDAMPNGGELKISSGFPTKALGNNRKRCITIEDTGKGISPEDISHIFDPFFSKKDRGTGLGLAITHEIIKNHNGRILVESQLNVGTKFTIELPITLPYETTQ